MFAYTVSEFVKPVDYIQSSVQLLRTHTTKHSNRTVTFVVQIIIVYVCGTFTL